MIPRSREDTANEFDKTWWEKHLALARDSARRGWALVRELREGADKLLILYNGLREINSQQVSVIADRGRTIANLVLQYEELERQYADMKDYNERQAIATVELEGWRGAYIMAIDEITKLRQVLGQKLVNEAEELFEKTRDGTLEATPGSGRS